MEEDSVIYESSSTNDLSRKGNRDGRASSDMAGDLDHPSMSFDD